MEGVEDGVKVKERTLRRLNATVGGHRAGTQPWVELLEH